MRMILKWDVPVDDHYHPIGDGEVVHVDCQRQPDVVQVWTDETDVDNIGTRIVRVYGTGQPLFPYDEHLGSVVTGDLVWHVLEMKGRDL